MPTIQLQVKKAFVITGVGTDKISLELDIPTAFPSMGYATYASFEAEVGYGARWVRENFGIEPEVLELHAERVPFSRPDKEPP